VSADAEIRQSMFKVVPHLRAFAISLTGNVDRADDLVQETLVRALSNVEKFQPGTSLQAWTFTILRNLFHTEHRKRRREVEDPEGLLAGRLASLPEQGARLDFDDLRIALTKLPYQQREALLLVGAEGLSYEEAAQVCGTHLGTIKSRVNRARTRLAEILGLDANDDFGPDRYVRAIMQDMA
jgi:RNA polymerase sigma-70 factor (ECF subfamily)